MSQRMIALTMLLAVACTECSTVRPTSMLVSNSKLAANNQYETMVILEPGIQTSTSLACISTNITDWMNYCLAFSKCASAESTNCSPISSKGAIDRSLNLTKYSATAKASSNSVTLKINDLGPSDEGFYKCELVNENSRLPVDQLIFKIIIAQRIDSVKFISTDAIKVEDDRMVLEDGRQGSLVCLVRGGYPLPKVDVYVDGKELTGQMMRHVQETDGMMETRLTDEKFTLTGLIWERKEIKCVARVEGRDLQGATLEDTKKIQLLHEPHVESCVTIDNPHVGRPSGVICTIIANPPIKHATWELKHLNVTLRANESSPHGMLATMRLGTLPQEPTKYNVRLDIANLSMSHAGEFSLTVSNTYGSKTHKIDFKPRSGNSKEGRAASQSALNSASAIAHTSHLLIGYVLFVAKFACLHQQ